jgi:hypothetical protein
MLKLWIWFRKLFHRHSSDWLSPEEIKDVAIAEKEIATGKAKTFKNANDLLADLHQARSKDRNLWPDTGRHRRGIPLPKAGQKATRQDVSKFMKHGHQAPWYRKSVKAKIQPEEEED